ncbi:MAG: hypothetical protein J6T29_00055 [Alphaproteobacteria bacterium]|nr:hypothetical protein [Alphaproteobacteria bacterium]
MKNLVLIFGFIVALFFNAETMQPAEFDNDQRGIPIVLYKVNIQPPVEVLQIRSKNIVQLGGIISKFIHIDCKEYNGFAMKAPIKINYDMSKQELEQSLCRSFGVNSVSYFEGIMPKDYFERSFSFFLKN